MKMASGLASTVLLSCVLASMAASCGNGGANPSEATAKQGGRSFQAVYWGRLVHGNGTPAAVAQYRLYEDACLQAGQATRQLGEGEIEDLGKVRFEDLQDESRWAIIRTEYTLGQGEGDAGFCQFRLDERSELVVAWLGEAPDRRWQFAEPSRQHQQEVIASNQASGWVESQPRTLHGQPCRVWTKGEQRLCMLDLPEYSLDQSAQAIRACDAPRGGFLALEHVQEPGAKTCEFVVESLRVGEPIPETVWARAASTPKMEGI